MSDALKSIREAQQSHAATPVPVSRALAQRLRDRATQHYSTAQKLTGQSKGPESEAHLHMGNACDHAAQGIEHALAGRPHLATQARQQAHKAYTAALGAHEGHTHEYGSPIRSAVGIPHPAAGEQMAKADEAHGDALPHVAEHLHVQLPSGERVHPMCDQGVAHLDKHVVKPARAHAETMESHLHGLMHGLDVSVKTRTKKADSLAEKVVRKNRPAQAMGDIIGARVTVHNPDHFPEAQRRLQEHMSGAHPMSGKHGVHVLSEEDSIKTPMESGYRSVHYNAQVHGIGTEVQLRQPHHTVWADYCHDNFYKDHGLNAQLDSSGHGHELEAVKAAGATYSKAVADHLAANGGKRGPDAPKAPAIIKKHGLEFPWHQL